MFHHQCCQLAVQFTEEDEVAVSGLVEHGNEPSLSVGGFLARVDGAHVGDIASVADVHVIDKVANVLNQASIANGHIAQCGIVNATILDKTVTHFYSSLAASQPCLSIENHAVASVGIEAFTHSNLHPVLSQASIGSQDFNLS